MKQLATCLLFLLANLSAEQPETLWTRPLVIGASLADGFNKNNILGPPSQDLSLHLHLDNALTTPHGTIENKGLITFFTDPESNAKYQIDFVATHKPTVIFAPDFLFWFLYGNIAGDESTRLENLQKGFTYLEKIAVPLIIGDIPDARHAAGGILNQAQIPEAKTIATANQRIRTWAQQRKQTGILPLAQFMAHVRDQKPIPIGKLQVRAQDTTKLLQPDQLHPTAEGAALIALAALQELQTITSFDQSSVTWTHPLLTQP
ncbi:MAG: hypothetical protein AAGC74_09090 [Verrucomicrobiota bacterium]